VSLVLVAAAFFLGQNIKITLSNTIARKWFLEWLRRMIG
jgi:hypothetical protein